MARHSDAESETGVRLTKVEPIQSLKLFSEWYPSFIIFVKREDCNNNIQKLPYKFIMECGEVIPKTIVLQMPNGHEIHAHYNKSEQCFSALSGFVKECKSLFGSLIVYSYKSNGIFSVHVFKSDLCEVEYFERRTIPRAPVCVQDNMTGIGWKFMVIVTNEVIASGEIAIPRSFWRRFGKLLPEKVKIVLRNGALFEGYTSQFERKMLGFQKLTISKMIRNNFTLLLSYFGGGKFEVLIFDKSDVENCLHEHTDSSDSSDFGSEMSQDDAEENAGMNLAGTEEIEINGMVNAEDNTVFDAVMKVSNINSSSHGVYIPQNIVPTNHTWESGVQVTLRTANGEWGIGIAMANTVPRLSRGWNKFCRDNSIRLNEMVIFRMVEEDEGIVFIVKFPNRN